MYNPNVDPTIRPLHEDDAFDVALVLERANAERDGLYVPTDLANPHSSANDIIRRMHIPGAWAYVAEDSGSVVGFALGYPASEAKGFETQTDADYLSLLMVDPTHWGKRIASRLLDTAATESRYRGYGRLMLWTRLEDNQRAQSVYEHKGFTFTGQTRDSKYGTQMLYVRGTR